MTRGFSLLETTFAGVVLMIGTVTLIAIGQNLASQVSFIRDTVGQPAIAERLIDEEIEMISDSPTAPATPPLVAPIGLEATGSAGQGAVYELRAWSVASQNGLSCYQIAAYLDGLPMQAATSSYVHNGGDILAPSVLVCRH